MSELSLRITPVKISIVDRTSDRLGFALIVVDAALVPPVMVSPAVKEPEGTVRVRLVEVGFVIIFAVVPLVPPVRVSPTVRLPEAATVAGISPTG
jgi:hypothetical protein|tara:strand:- start:683 stop:967 length:285 start_codon:yes stop_codon:yes gene_type:complete